MRRRGSWAALALGILLCSAAPACAQDSLDIAGMVPKMQAALKDAACPASASAQSCASFHKLVESGSQELTAQFAPAFLDQKIHLYLIYVVFDNTADRFWVIAADVVHADNGPVLASGFNTYGEYQEGRMVTGAINKQDVPLGDNATTWSSKEDGVTVSYYEAGNTSVISKESWQASDGGTRTITISVDKTHPGDAREAPETITLESPTQKAVRSGTALKFTTPESSAPKR